MFQEYTIMLEVEWDVGSNDERFMEYGIFETSVDIDVETGKIIDAYAYASDFEKLNGFPSRWLSRKVNKNPCFKHFSKEFIGEFKALIDEGVSDAIADGQ